LHAKPRIIYLKYILIMPKRDWLVWLMVILSVASLALYPLFYLVTNAPVQAWELALLLNILFPLVLWMIARNPESKEQNNKKHLTERHEESLKIPGLELKIPIWLVSLVISMVFLVPGLLRIANFYSASAFFGQFFFEGLFSAILIIWGISAFIASYAYLKSRKANHGKFVFFQIHSPVLGITCGIIGAVQVLFMLLLNYVSSSMSHYAALGEDGMLSLFYLFFSLARVNQIKPVALELITGIFLIEIVIILSIYFSRKSYGRSPALEYEVIAKNLAVAVISYSILFFLIPLLFSPLSMLVVWV
jgi:hypothetical protein